MSNYSLEAVATKVDDMDNNPQRNVSVSVENQLQLADGFGLSQTLNPSYSGIVFVRLYETGVSDGSLGPNDRTVAASASTVSVSNNTITVASHGFEENGIVRIKLPVSGGGSAPGGVVLGQEYYANVVDGNTIKLKTTSGGSALNITSSGSGNFLVTRDLLVAYNVSDWVTTSSSAVMVTMVNFPFKYGTDAYKWLARYSTAKNVAFCCGGNFQTSTQSSFFYWNRIAKGDRPTPAIAGGAEWEPFDDVYFYGNLKGNTGWGFTGSGKKIGVTNFTANGKTYLGSGVGLSYDIPEAVANPGYGNWRNYVFAPHDRCRMITTVYPSDSGIPFWFRYPKKVYINHIWLDFQVRETGYVGSMIRTGAKVTTLNNVAIYNWTQSSAGASWGNFNGAYTPILVGEGGAKLYNVGSALLIAYGVAGGNPYYLGAIDKGIVSLSPHGYGYYGFWQGGGDPSGIWERGLSMYSNNLSSNGTRASGILMAGNADVHEGVHYSPIATSVRFTLT